MPATDALLEMGAGNKYRQAGNGEYGIRALTLRPGRHEIIQRQDLVREWRVARLARLGILRPVAEAAADQVDWHHMAALV
jgi:hypothetical protein